MMNLWKEQIERLENNYAFIEIPMSDVLYEKIKFIDFDGLGYKCIYRDKHYLINNHYESNISYFSDKNKLEDHNYIKGVEPIYIGTHVCGLVQYVCQKNYKWLVKYIVEIAKIKIERRPYDNIEHRFFCLVPSGYGYLEELNQRKTKDIINECDGVYLTYKLSSEEQIRDFLAFACKENIDPFDIYFIEHKEIRNDQLFDNPEAFYIHKYRTYIFAYNSLAQVGIDKFMVILNERDNEVICNEYLDDNYGYGYNFIFNIVKKVNGFVKKYLFGDVSLYNDSALKLLESIIHKENSENLKMINLHDIRKLYSLSEQILIDPKNIFLIVEFVQALIDVPTTCFTCEVEGVGNLIIIYDSSLGEQIKNQINDIIHHDYCYDIVLPEVHIGEGRESIFFIPCLNDEDCKEKAINYLLTKIPEFIAPDGEHEIINPQYVALDLGNINIEDFELKESNENFDITYYHKQTIMVNPPTGFFKDAKYRIHVGCFAYTTTEGISGTIENIDFQHDIITVRNDNGELESACSFEFLPSRDN